jgi:hypothetical protein
VRVGGLTKELADGKVARETGAQRGGRTARWACR